MKRAPWLVLAGTVAGFLAVIGFHESAGRATSAPVAGSAASEPTASSAAAGPSASPSSARPPAAAGRIAVTGPVEPYGYGELAVRVTVSGGRITRLTVPMIKTAEPYSQQLATQAIPVLRNEVLAAQSTHVNAVSGASYTSQAYATSIQAALDRLHFK
jgi:hypothetical protein